MEKFNLFQDRIESDLSKIAKIEKHFDKMHELLESSIEEEELEDELFHQLTWLKFQIDYGKEEVSAQLLIDNYSRVLSNFNNDLCLDTSFLLFLYED